MNMNDRTLIDVFCMSSMLYVIIVMLLCLAVVLFDYNHCVELFQFVELCPCTLSPLLGSLC